MASRSLCAVCMLFRVLNPSIESAEEALRKKNFETLSLSLFSGGTFFSIRVLCIYSWRQTTTTRFDDGASSKRPTRRPKRGRRRTIRENVVRGRQSETDEREGWENVGVILRVRENGEEDDVDDEDSTNWNDVDGEPFEYYYYYYY